CDARETPPTATSLPRLSSATAALALDPPIGVSTMPSRPKVGSRSRGDAAAGAASASAVPKTNGASLGKLRRRIKSPNPFLAASQLGPGAPCRQAPGKNPLALPVQIVEIRVWA